MDSNLKTMRIKARIVILAGKALVTDPVVVGIALVELDHIVVAVDLGYDAGCRDAKTLFVTTRDICLADFKRHMNARRLVNE